MVPRRARGILDKSKINCSTKNPVGHAGLTAAASFTVAKGGTIHLSINR